MLLKSTIPSHSRVLPRFKSSVSIDNGELISGKLPTRQFRLIQAWVEIHREELQDDWELCQNGEAPFKITPLK
ncbi:MAG: DUF4160 domain-containing protein [Cyclobacteriaceae bacterium]